MLTFPGKQPIRDYIFHDLTRSHCREKGVKNGR